MAATPKKGEQKTEKRPFRQLILLEDEPTRDYRQDELGMLHYAEVVAGTAAGTIGPFTIGVFADWGLGKTSVLRQAKSLIDDAEDSDIQRIVTVWFNAWQFEHEEHPIVPLTATIVREMESKYKKLQSLPTKLAETASGAWRNSIRALRAIAYGFSAKGKVGIPGFAEVEAGFVAKEMIERFEKLEQAEKLRSLDDPLLARSLYYDAFEMLDRRSGTEAGKGEPKVVVFIDDLDRCMPDKAVMLLENIKLVFGQRGFVFALAVARPVLDGFLAKLYDKDFNIQDSGVSARSYLDKIVQLALPLPSHKERFAQYIRELVDRPALADVKKVFTDDPMVRTLAVAADYNPRSLVRFLNNLLVDRFVYESKDQDDLKEKFLPFCIVSRCLQKHLDDSLYRSLVEDRSLCEAIAKKGEGDFVRRWVFEELSDRRMRAELEDALDSQDRRRMKILRGLDRHDCLRQLLDNTPAGHDWLSDHDTRHRIDNFLELERPKPVTPEPEAPIAFDANRIIDDAIRNELSMGVDVPITADNRRNTTRLDLSNTQVTNAELECLKPLTQLQRLSLDNTQVTDAGLECLKPLTQLQELSLDNTQVTDAGLKRLKSLTQLQRLYLSYTQVTDAGLERLKPLTQLQRLGLSSTQVTDAGLECLKPLTQLQRLGLSYTQVTDAGLKCLKPLTQLQWLFLDNTQITDAGLECLKPLTQLREIYLINTQVTDAGLECLKPLTQLQRLGLSNTQVTDAGLECLKPLTQLRELGLSNTQVTDVGLECLRSLTQLQMLYLSNTQVTDAGLEYLKPLTQLQGLFLDNTQVTGVGREELRKAFPNCRIIW